MIRVTNDCKSFIENESGNIYIYGAGNAGYWVGYYLSKCNISYVGYIDKRREERDVLYNNHPVYEVGELNNIKHESIRMIITPYVYKEILGELLWYDHLFDMDIICLIPRYKSISSKDDVYNINKMLGYFRRKLFKGEVPTIISNTCVGGHIYDALGLPLASPTINVNIEGEDYIKLVNDISYYFTQELKCYGWIRECRSDGIDTPHIIGKVGDITIKIGHTDTFEQAEKRWNLMIERVNWNRIVYIMEEQKYRPPVSLNVCKKFMQLDGKKLLILTKKSLSIGGEDIIYVPDEYFMVRDEPVLENYFDILEWINI